MSWDEGISNGKGKYQRFTITPEFKIETNITAELSGNNKGAIKIGHIPFTIPGIVPLYCEVEIFAGVDVEGKISLSAELSYSHSTTFGFEYNGSFLTSTLYFYHFSTFSKLAYYKFWDTGLGVPA